MQLGMSLKADLIVFSRASVTKAVWASRPLPAVLPEWEVIGVEHKL